MHLANNFMRCDGDKQLLMNDTNQGEGHDIVITA